MLWIPFILGQAVIIQILPTCLGLEKTNYCSILIFVFKDKIYGHLRMQIGGF